MVVVDARPGPLVFWLRLAGSVWSSGDNTAEVHVLKAPTRFAVLFVILALSSACGVSGASRASQTGSSSPAKALIPIKMATGTVAMNDTPIWVALDGGLFKQNGIDLQLIQFATAAPQLEAVKAGDVQFANTGTVNFLRGIESGVKLLAVARYTTGVTLSMTIRSKVLQRAGVTASDPRAQKLAVLKGLTLGIEAPGGVVDGMTRYVLRQAKLQVGRDVKVVSIDGGGALLAAMQHHQIDGFMASPPWPQQSVADGFGTILFSGPGGDFPGFSEAISNELAVDPAYAAAHPQVVRAMVHAVAEANALIAAHPKKVVGLLGKQFGRVASDVLAPSVKELQPAFPTDLKMSAAGWAEANDLFEQAGILKHSVATPEGTVWTNRYIAS